MSGPNRAVIAIANWSDVTSRRWVTVVVVGVIGRGVVIHKGPGIGGVEMPVPVVMMVASEGTSTGGTRAVGVAAVDVSLQVFVADVSEEVVVGVVRPVLSFSFFSRKQNDAAYNGCESDEADDDGQKVFDDADAQWGV